MNGVPNALIEMRM